MTYPRTLVMVRHGQSEANLVQKGIAKAPSGFHQAADVHVRLTNEGRRQAQVAGEWLTEHGYAFSRHYVSPFFRAIETASKLNISNEWLIDDLWRERDWGEYGRYSKDEQEKLFKDSTAIKNQFAWYWKPQGGESLATGVRSRVNSVLTHLSRLEEAEAVIGVTHGEFISTAQFVIEKMTPHQWVERERNEELTIRNANIVEYTRVNPENPNDIRSFYKWGRVTNPWDKNLSHYHGEWYTIQSHKYSMSEMNTLISGSELYFPNH
jgi:broad specificity phosphatase PhoE